MTLELNSQAFSRKLMSNIIRMLKVIHQKLKLPMEYFETFLECSLPSTVLKNTIKMIGYYFCLRDVTGQSYPIYDCTHTSHVRYSLPGPSYILQ